VSQIKDPVWGQQVVLRGHELTQHVELIEAVLDKGVVIDTWTRLSLLGLDIMTVEARVVVTSLDTYVRYADAIAAIT
jgi:gas vesicle structural protein